MGKEDLMQMGLGLAQAAGFGAFVVLIAVLLFIVFVLASAVRIVQEYERGVVFRR
jgi:regulator of protease activity HflC (stomatin/prohibitin superfamily)